MASPQSSLPAIAVVAVHGVGDHKPGASAHAIADLLLRLRYRGGASRYTPFTEKPLRVPTRPAVVGDAPAQGSATPEHALMRGQLEHYHSDGEPYETVRIAGERLSDSSDGRPARPEAIVHVYEMYWSDLSHVGASALRVFGEMYQMLFHLAVLGLIALRGAGADVPADPRAAERWRRHERLHASAVQLLTAAVPATWLVMLATALGFVVLQSSPGVKSAILGIAAGLGAAGAVWLFVYDSALLWRRLLAWAAIPLTGALVGLAAWGAAGAEEHAPHRDALVLIVWVIAAAATLRIILRSYDRVCPGALYAGRLAGAAAAALLVASVLRFTPEAFGERDLHLLGNAVVNTFELETLGVVLVWYATYGCAAAAAWLGRGALRAQPDEAARRRLFRAVWTARATIAISASALLLFTFVLWAAVLRASAALLPDPARAPSPLAIWTPFQARGYEELFHRIISTTAGAGFPLLVIIMCVLGVTTALALLPAAAREVWPTRTGAGFTQGARPDGPPAGDPWAELADEGRLSERLGVWLSQGYERVVLVVAVLFLATFVLQPAVSVLGWVTPWPATPLPGLNFLGRTGALGLGWLEREGHTIIVLGGSILAATAVGLVALRGRLQRLALGFRPILDAVLDVDNYLREHPRENTPRARIAERFTSLLRNLSHWESESGQRYQAIVLVAHSQGTVISADTLGFIGREHDPELEALAPHRDATSLRADRRLYLFTMGSPLRQLYGWCFPWQFGWLSERPRRWGDPAPLVPASGSDREISREWRTPDREPDGHHVAGPAIPDDASPDPHALGLARWVNAYRSGDYVGRALWRGEMADCAWLYRTAPEDARAVCPSATPPLVVVSEDAGGSRRELCIGGGAHTHYWDDTAHAVAAELDLLVAEAAAPIAGPAVPTRPSAGVAAADIGRYTPTSGVRT